MLVSSLLFEQLSDEAISLQIHQKINFFKILQKLSHISVKANDCLALLLKIAKFEDSKKILETHKLNKAMTCHWTVQVNKDCGLFI